MKSSNYINTTEEFRESDKAETQLLKLSLLIVLFLIVPIGMTTGSVIPALANGGGCYTTYKGSENKWTPVLIGHAPYAPGTPEGKGYVKTTKALTGKFTFPFGYYSQIAHSSAIYPKDGKTYGYFRLARWAIYERRCSISPDGFTARVSNWDPLGYTLVINEPLYGSSQSTDADDLTSFYRDGYNSMGFHSRYSRKDLEVRTYGGPQTFTIGYQSSLVYQVSASVNVGQYFSAGLIEETVSASSDFLYEYTFPQGFKWYVTALTQNPPSDVFKHAWAFKYVGTTGGVGCPYISLWNGFSYEPENNILPQSESGAMNEDVTDYYLIQKPIQYKDEMYSFQLQEFENEISHLNRIQLFSIEYPSPYDLILSSDGIPMLYGDADTPKSATSQDGDDLLPFISRLNDGNFLEGATNDYVILDFGKVNSETAKLLFNTDYKMMSIHVQVFTEDGGWTDVGSIIPRSNWYMDGLDISHYLSEIDENLLVKLIFTAEHKLDFVGLDTTSNRIPIFVHPLDMSIAWHITQGNVTEALLAKDDQYAILRVGDDISFYFDKTVNIPGFKAALMLQADGFYHKVPE